MKHLSASELSAPDRARAAESKATGRALVLARTVWVDAILVWPKRRVDFALILCAA